MNKTVNSLVWHKVTLVWLLLVAATCLSWWMGNADGHFGPGLDLSLGNVSSVLLVVAFIKVRFVMRHFMEVRDATIILKLLIDTWVVVVCGVLLYLYWFGPQG